MPVTIFKDQDLGRHLEHDVHLERLASGEIMLWCYECDATLVLFEHTTEMIGECKDCGGPVIAVCHACDHDD